MSKAKIIQKKVIEDSEEDSSSQLPLITTKKEQIKAKKEVKKVQPESSEEDQTPVVKAKETKKASKASIDEQEQPVQKKPVKTLKTQNGAVRKNSVDKKKKKESSSEESSEDEAPKKVVKVKSPAQKPVAKKVAKKLSSSEQSSEEQKPVKKTVKSPAQKPVVVKKAAKKQTSSDESSEQEKPVKKVAKSPAQKPVLSKKVAKKQSSDEQSEQQVKPTKKATKSPVQKAVVAKKKVVQQSSQEQQEEKPKAPVRKASKDSVKVVKKVVQAQEPYEQCEVCVQGLSFNAFDSDIRALFELCGQIVHVNLLMRPDGKPKGTAFVKFNKKSSLKNALQLNETQHLGRQIRVEQARGKQGGQQGGFNKREGGAPRGNQSYESNAVIETPTLFIGGLSYISTNDSIKDFFSQIGEVQSARVVTDKQTGKPRGFGYIEFYDVQTAKKAYAALNGSNLDGRNIRLDSAAQRDRPAGGSRGGFGGGSFGGSGFGGGSRGGFGGPSRNPGNSTVVLSQDDKNAKKGAIGTFQGKKITL